VGSAPSISGAQVPAQLPARWMAVTFSTDGIVRSLTPNLEQLTGYPGRQLVGQPIALLLLEWSDSDLSQIMRSAKEWGEWVGTVVYRSLCGGALRTRSSLTPLCGNGQDGMTYLLMSTPAEPDTATPRHITGIGEVASKMRSFAHELNNPLAVVMGLLQLLALNSRTETSQRSELEKLYAETRRMALVVERLHAYGTSLEAGHS
jgi:nitrogen-specific signal transduction histidine kinase